MSQELMWWHQPRVGALVCGGVDILAFDTIPAKKEAQAIAQLLETEFPNTKVWIAFSCKVSNCNLRFIVTVIIEWCRNILKSYPRYTSQVMF